MGLLNWAAALRRSLRRAGFKERFGPFAPGEAESLLAEWEAVENVHPLVYQDDLVGWKGYPRP